MEGTKSTGKGHLAQATEGARSTGKDHMSQASEGARSTGKGNGPEETLMAGKLQSGNDMKAMGNKATYDEATTSDGDSNLETLRQGDKPAAEKVQAVKFDQDCLKKARMLNERSENGGAEKEGGW